jgi:hypothetical protein
MTVTQYGELVDNQVVVQEAEAILQQEFCCYGYKNICDELGYSSEHDHFIPKQIDH